MEFFRSISSLRQEPVTSFNVKIELNRMAVDEIFFGGLQEQLSAYRASVGTSQRGWLAVRLTLPAESALQATSTAIAVVERLFAAQTIVAEVMTEVEYSARQGFTEMPDLYSVSETAELLDRSRARVNQMLEERVLPGIKVGNTFAIPAEAVQAAALRTVTLRFEGESPREEHYRQILDPMYDDLRVIGVMRAYNAYLAAEASGEYNAPFAQAWVQAKTVAIHEMLGLGYNTAKANIVAMRLPRIR